MKEVKTEEVKTAEAIGITKKIKLTNSDVVMLTQQMTTNDGKIAVSPAKNAFDKLQAALVTSGKPYYWVYRTWKKINSIAKEVEEDRIALAKQFCDKDSNGDLKFIDDQYQFDPDQKKEYDMAVKSMESSSIEVSPEVKNAIAEKFCRKGKDDKPIKAGGSRLKFSEEGLDLFNKTYTTMLNEEIIFDNDKIIIDSTLLGSINEKLEALGKEMITLNDMLMMEKIFDFVE